jgi:hypothetical protein
MENDNDDEIDLTPHNWASFSMVFVGMFPYIPHDEAPRDCFWRVGNTWDTLASDFGRAQAPFLPEIEKVIRTLCDTGNAQNDSKAVGYFLGLRGCVLESFFLSLSVPKGQIHETIIPFPTKPLMKTLEWFLIDWWNFHGPRQICRIRLIEDHLPID